MFLTDALDTAVSLYHQGQIIDLEKLCRRILAVAPDHPDALNLMALALHGIGHFTEAVDRIARAVALHPESLVYRNSLAMLRAAAGDPVAAEEEYRRLLALQPDMAGLRLGLASCLIDQGSVLAAERVLSDLPANLTPGEMTAASLSYERIGWSAKALSLARAAYRMAPQALEVRLRLAEALARAGALDEMPALLETCLADERLGYVARLDFVTLLHRGGFNDLTLYLLQKMAKARPEDAKTLSYFGALLLDEGHLAAAEAVLRKSLKLCPNQGQVIFNHALALHKLGYPDAAIESYRRALAFDENCEDARINLLALLAETGERGLWSDLTSAPRPESNRHQFYVLCFPKSGSTFLCTVLEQLTGLRMTVVTQGYFQNEQEFSRDMMLKLAMQDYIVHQHCRATIPNVHLLQAFDIRPVILVRNLADALVSMVDYLTKESQGNTFFGLAYRHWSLERRIDAVIARYAHWYIEFFASWTRERRRGALDCCFVRYEDMIADKPGTVMRVAQFLGLPGGSDEVMRAVSRSDNAQARTLFNKGVAGRGRATLSLAQLQELERLAKFYPDIDFRPIGLAAHPD